MTHGWHWHWHGMGSRGAEADVVRKGTIVPLLGTKNNSIAFGQSSSQTIAPIKHYWVPPNDHSRLAQGHSPLTGGHTEITIFSANGPKME